MEYFSEEIRYGLRLYPFAVVVMSGMFLTNLGPTLFRSLIAGMSGVPLYNVISITGILLLQLAGGIVAAAGFFGALYKVLNDSGE